MHGTTGFAFVALYQNQKIKSSLYSRYYAEACSEWRGPSPRLSVWPTQLRRNFTTVATGWLHCANLTGPAIEPQTSRTDGVRLTTELNGRCSHVPTGKKELDCFTRKASKGRFLLLVVWAYFIFAASMRPTKTL